MCANRTKPIIRIGSASQVQIQACSLTATPSRRTSVVCWDHKYGVHVPHAPLPDMHSSAVSAGRLAVAAMSSCITGGTHTRPIHRKKVTSHTCQALIVRHLVIIDRQHTGYHYVHATTGIVTPA